jgi:hypothetical protein
VFNSVKHIFYIQFNDHSFFFSHSDAVDFFFYQYNIIGYFPIGHKTSLIFRYHIWEQGINFVGYDLGEDFVSRIAKDMGHNLEKDEGLSFLGMRAIKVEFVAPPTFFFLRV